MRFSKNPLHSRLHPRIKGCMGLADELLLRAYTCVCGRITCQLKACTKDQKGTRVWPTNCCCEHTHMCVKKQPVPGCTQGSQVTRDWPTNCENMSSQGCTQGPRDTSFWPTMCCCEHTHVCCRIYQFRVAPISVKGYNSLADQLLLREHTCDMCVAEKKSTQGWFGRPHPDRKTHMCAITRVWPTKKYTCVSQNKYTQGCMQGFRESRNTRVWRRPVAAVSIHMCVAG